MNTSPTLPGTQNLDWGFFGTLGQHAQAAWPLAMTAVCHATGEPPDAVRAFLDSRHGRHFAYDVLTGLHAGSSLPDAIDRATTQWMAWRIGRRTRKQYGIPAGVPYLTGFVVHSAVLEDCGAAD